jgi:hypothetical protein
VAVGVFNFVRISINEHNTTFPAIQYYTVEVGTFII